jgi:hypothetical protein
VRTYNDIIIPDLATETVQAAFRSAMARNEMMFRDNRTQLVDFYVSQQTDEDHYLKAYFNKETRPGKEPDYPHNLVLSQMNFTGKIIDKKAKNYRQQPVRKVDGRVAENYTELLIAGGIKTSSKLMDRFTWLLGDHCVVIVADANTQKIRIDNPTYYRPIFESGNQVDPVGVIYPIGRVLNNQGAWVQGWQYWDAETQQILEESTWNPIGEVLDNPHGCFNVIFTHRMKPFRGHWTRDAQDLIDTNRDINILITSINNAFRRVGFPNLAIIGMEAPRATDTFRSTRDGSIPIGTNTTSPEAPAVKVGFDQAMYVSGKNPDSPAPDVKYLIPGVDWNQLVGVVTSKIEMLASTWNVDIRWSLGGDMASGIALKVLSVDNREDVSDMQELYEEYFEIPLHEKLLTIQDNVEWIKGVEAGRLTIDWPEEQFLESPNERVQRYEKEIELNLTNSIDIIKDENPDLDDAAALKQYLRNVKINRMLKSQAGGSGDDIMDALMGNFDERGRFDGMVNDLNKEFGVAGATPAGEPNPEDLIPGAGE